MDDSDDDDVDDSDDDVDDSDDDDVDDSDDDDHLLYHQIIVTSISFT